MDVHGNGDLQLGAPPIGTGDQNRFLILFHVQREERSERANAPEHAVGESACGEMADAVFGVIRDSDIDSSVGVSHRIYAATFVVACSAMTGVSLLPCELRRRHQKIWNN